MVNDGQVRKLQRLLSQGRSLAASARMTGMDEKTARRYRDDGALPSQNKQPRKYRTRLDPFEDVWPEVQERLEAEPRLQARTLLSWLQDRYPGRFADTTRRTFERRVRLWRSTYGPGKTVMFPQVHHPGQIAASDFTVMNSLRVTIAGSPFEHTLFHCVLTYSNVESISLCFSESFEALSEGVQKAFWEFGGVPDRHGTDSLSAAINNHATKQQLTARYDALMQHYDVTSERTNVRCANENGDVESSNGHVKNAIDQALMLRGSRNFEDRDQYMQFVEDVVQKRNHERRDKFTAEQDRLGPLPKGKLDSHDTLRGISVNSSCTIRVRGNRYSVPSRLIGEKVDVTIRAECIEVTHHGNLVQRMPRLTGVGGAAINYRHVIDSLIRKPGAFENYKYREDMFPTSHFRMAYDFLVAAHSNRVAVRKYLEILALAARESQDAVQDALRLKIQLGEPIDIESIRELITQATEIRPATDVQIDPPNLNDFDSLLEHPDMESPCNEAFLKSANHNEETSLLQTACDTVTKDENSRTDFSGERVAGEGADRAVSLTPAADVPGSFSKQRGPGGSGGAEPSGISLGTDESRMRSSERGTHQTADDALPTPLEQDLGNIRQRTSSLASDTSTGEPPRWLVSGSSRKPVDFWQTGRGKIARSVCAGSTIGSTGPEHVIYDLQLVGSAVAGSETRPAAAQGNKAAVRFRGDLDRRPRLRTAESRRDGGVVHAVGGALRTRECVADKQSSVQQMGPDFQGRHDDCGSDRPLGSPQHHHRAERAELPCRNGKANQVPITFGRCFGAIINFITGNSNCR